MTEERPPVSPEPTASAPAPASASSASAAPTATEVAIGDAPTKEPQADNVIHGFKPTILRGVDVGPEVLLHGYSDCHLGSGAEVQCTGPVDVELLSRDKGPVTSAQSPNDIAQRSPNRVKLFRQALCHDFFVRLSAKAPVKCDVAVHAVTYPD
jgi:hypothetical protein